MTEIEIEVKRKYKAEDKVIKTDKKTIKESLTEKIKTNNSILEIELTPADKHEFLKQVLMRKSHTSRPFMKMGHKKRKHGKLIS